MTLEDWLGLLPTYGAIIAVGLVIAFSVSNLIGNKLQSQRDYSGFIYAIAGTLCMACILLLMRPIMHITLIAGARGVGFYWQLLAGVLGGVAFSFLLKLRLKKGKTLHQ